MRLPRRTDAPAGRRAAALTCVLLALVGSMLAPHAPTASAALDIDGPASGGSAADRGVQRRIGVTCDLATVRALATQHPSVRQFVVAQTDSFAATAGAVFVAGRQSDGSWACQSHASYARFGRAGTRPLAQRRSGDDTAPAGVFPLGKVTAWDGQTFSVFGNRSSPGTRTGVTYRSVRNEDCWGATANTASYNHLVDRPGCPGPDDEWLPRFGDVYEHAVVIGANLSPVSGDAPGETPYAAAIFLHRHSYTTAGVTKATSGCVTLDHDALVEVIRLLEPGAHFAIGPTAYLRQSA